MSEHRIKQDINLFEIVDEYTKRISRVIDEQTLANVKNQLAEYGYVKVVRCRDCKHFTPKGTHKFENGKTNADYCTYVRGWMLQITPDGFCAWASKREEGGE